VFAQAREKARGATCTSNIKQMGTAFHMYLQDYDELMPLVYRVGPPRVTWATLIQPYEKNWQMHKCPNMADATSSGVSIWVGANPQNLTIWQGYGINVDYMALAKGDCSDFVVANKSGPPTALAAVGQPAGTVMLTGCSLAMGTGSFADGVNTLYPVGGGEFRTFAPATLTTPEGCTYTNGSWGQGSLSGPYGGFEQPRHKDQGGTVCFVDGHVKWMNAGALAAGTNWSISKKNSDISVTDRNQYLWDLQ
jgi:prepilin-type processing-associated H-X9-DG protein